MEIRLRGTPAETDTAITALHQVLTITTVSRPYPDRDSTVHRVYLTAIPNGARQ